MFTRFVSTQPYMKEVMKTIVKFQRLVYVNKLILSRYYENLVPALEVREGNKLSEKEEQDAYSDYYFVKQESEKNAQDLLEARSLLISHQITLYFCEFPGELKDTWELVNKLEDRYYKESLDAEYQDYLMYTESTGQGVVRDNHQSFLDG